MASVVYSGSIARLGKGKGRHLVAILRSPRPPQEIYRDMSGWSLATIEIRANDEVGLINIIALRPVREK